MAPVATFSQLVPASFGYVALAASATGPLLFWQMMRVGAARKAAKIEYPQLYATPEQQKASKEALLFNCAQRAHQNTLETLPLILFTTVLTGLQYPRYAAGACAAYIFGRILYTLGYSTGDPKKRNRGIVGSLATVALVGSSLYTSARMVLDGRW